MKKEVPEESKILTEAKLIRKHQTLSSFDTIFLILVPVITLIISYILNNPKLVSADLPRNFYYFSLIFVFVIPLFFGIRGILEGSVKYRMYGWFIFFGSIWTSITFYGFTYIYWDLIPNIGGPYIVFIIMGFLVGSLLVGYGAGDVYGYFLWKRLLKRLKEIDEKIKTDFSLPKQNVLKNLRLAAIGFCINILFMFFMRLLGAPSLYT